MYAHSAVGIFSAVILIAIGFCVVTNSHSADRMNKNFFRIIILTFISVLAEAGSWFFNGRPDLMFFLDVVNFLTFLLGNVVIWFLLRYLFVILSEKTQINRFWNVIIALPSVATVPLLIMDRFNHMYYHIDENGFYVEGELYMISTIFPVISFIIATVVLVRFRKYLGKDSLVLVTAYSVLPTILIIIQALHKESFILTVFSSNTVTFALVIILIYGGIQSQIGKRLSEQLTDVAVEKERISTELGIATDIQASMLPRIFPPFPERDEIDLYASMNPAKEVGGDFYDFFVIDDVLWCIMADVSGKGVPAALFMAIGKVLIKNAAQSGKRPGEVTESVNNMLCEGNETGLFITAFISCLNLKTGEFTYSNAGHNAPLINRKDGWEYLQSSDPDLPLALYDTIPYEESSFMLERGSKIFLYTDGVTEAFNLEGEMYEEHRLLAVANAFRGDDPRAFAESVKSDLDAFVNGAEQSDDITVLALIYKGDST